MSRIEIMVSPTGQTQVQTYGFEGASCRAGSQFLEWALGHPTQEQLTPEFYQAQVATDATETETT
ncbi:MAG: hypothetical protein JWN70_2987 [Planctomycetaceae bacterium]|nr:hypothetical protein [Planctomycetaceae bacterium]